MTITDQIRRGLRDHLMRQEGVTLVMLGVEESSAFFQEQYDMTSGAALVDVSGLDKLTFMGLRVVTVKRPGVRFQ